MAPPARTTLGCVRQLIPRHKIEWLSQEADTFPGGREALAQAYGFDSWAQLESEVEFRRILDVCDADRLRAIVTAEPARAEAGMRGWCDHPGGPAPLSYVAMMRYDTLNQIWRDVPGAAELAQVSSTRVPQSTASRERARRPS